MENSRDSRKFSRVDFQIIATVTVGDKKLVGRVENLSLRGAFLITDQGLEVGDEAGIVISLNENLEKDHHVDLHDEGMVIDVCGRVSRVTEKGIAFTFDKIDFDSYVHLKNLIALNIGDASKVEDEMGAFLGDFPRV